MRIDVHTGLEPFGIDMLMPKSKPAEQKVFRTKCLVARQKK